MLSYGLCDYPAPIVAAFLANTNLRYLSFVNLAVVIVIGLGFFDPIGLGY